MSFDPQNPLERSLMQAATDPAHRPQFYRDVAESDLFVIQEGPPPEASGRAVLQQGMSIQIQHVDWNGKPFIPVFSSLRRLQGFLREEASYLALNAIEFMKITRGAEFILNPGSEYGKEFTREEIASLIDGTLWQPSERYVAEKSTEVMLGQPSNYPTELVAALSRYFKNTKEVKRAWLAHFFNPDRNEQPHTLICVEVSGDWDRVMAGAGMVAQAVQVPDPPVDFIPMTGLAGVEDYFRKECQPFYQRKLFGIF